MGTTESSFSRKERLLIILLAVIAMLITTVAVVPSLRSEVKTFF